MARSPRTTCPVCGADVHPNALACRECGADENSGWRDDRDEVDGLSASGVPDDDFDYDQFVAAEFGHGASRNRPKTVWVVAAALLLAAFLAAYILRF